MKQNLQTMIDVMIQSLPVEEGFLALAAQPTIIIEMEIVTITMARVNLFAK